MLYNLAIIKAKHLANTKKKKPIKIFMHKINNISFLYIYIEIALHFKANPI